MSNGWRQDGDLETIKSMVQTKRTVFATLCLFLAGTTRALGDLPSPRVPHVVAGESGTCYARSIPEKGGGDAASGKTTVYLVTEDEDRELYSFDWYSPILYISCNSGESTDPLNIAVVRRGGPWPAEGGPSEEHTALEFYFRGELQRRYSTLDIARNAENVLRTVSWYFVFDSVGFEDPDLFSALTTDGRTMFFDPTTGERVSCSP